MDDDVVEFSTDKYRLFVKSSFIEKCPDPGKHSVRDLMIKYRLSLYLHNPKGPAVIRLKDNVQEWWIDGQKISDEEAKRLSHNIEFHNKLFNLSDE